MNRIEILELMEKEKVEFVRFLYVDNDGLIRGYVSPKKSVLSDLASGHAYTKAMPFFSALDTVVPDSRFGCVGEFRAVPDLETFRLAPYVAKTATVICDFKTIDHEPAGVCGRLALKKFLNESSYQFKASFENEFYFALEDGHGNLRPFDRSLCFATLGMNSTAAIIAEIMEALEVQGIEVEKYYPEYGPGQQEIVCKYDSALKAADNQVLFRETVRGIAEKFGVTASFMPKPFQNLAGSGGHIHISIWDDGKNLFYDEASPHKLSDLAHHFIGGILDHLPAICAFTAAIVTSYKRLIPHNWASCTNTWGFDNREAAVRVCSGQFGRERETVNIEIKAADSANNPYLSLLAIIAAGIDGIKRGLSPGEPQFADPLTLSAEEQKKFNIRRLPRTLGEAMEALKRDYLYREILGELLWDEYIKLKEFNWSQYNNQVTPWEIARYAKIF